MFTMRVEGGEQLARALGQLSTRASKGVLREALRTVGAPPIRDAAEVKAPRDPGAPDLASHIVISTGRERGADAAIVIGPSVETRSDQPTRRFDIQGLFVEFGTIDTPMVPFMRTAFESEAVKTLGPIGFALWRAIAAKGITARTSPGGGGLV